MPDRPSGAAPAEASADAGLIPLTELPLDTCAVVAEVRAATDDVEVLKTMGVCEGRRVMLVRRGDPMIVKVLGARLGVSARLAELVLTRPCPAGPEGTGA
ncbi:MAG: ferrous iron transport protein A [Acidobacteria bacterium]|nr:MAG: ferrous iron transport protein A [Acidobacteriota bacterium]